MTKPVRFMNNNHITTGNLSVTSEVAAFPSSNLLNSSRTKVHKASGHFEITTSNQNFYIDDGSPKTVAITTGNYTTGEALRAQLQTDLNAASSGWTVLYNAGPGDYRFQFLNAGSVELTISSTTDAIWDTIGFIGSTDLTGTFFTADEPRIHSYERLVVDLGVPQEMTFMGAIAPLDEVFFLSDTGTAKFMGNNADVWDSPNFSKTLTNDPRGLLAFPEDDAGFGAHRYWAFEVTDRTNSLGPEGVKLGVLHFGTYDTITTSNVARGFSKAQEDPSVELTSISGSRFFDEKVKFERFSGLQIQNIELTDVKTIEQIFYDQGISRPFFMSLDPGLAFSDVLTDETRYVTFDGRPDKDHAFLKFYDLSFDAREDV